ncbi:WFDC3 [Mytilus edulis]|uniref:WFDC3 n=1 Tax=Mytilus edulis TaxID=6550 RepID=A0A8S3Q5F3_MYTED|nr:WFDC3 [Mytilus edulis]
MSENNGHALVMELRQRSKKSIRLLNDQAKAYRKQVNDSYAKGVQKLREKREKVIDCLEKIHERNEKRLNTTNEKLTSFLVNANECCKISEELLENSSKNSFLTLERTVREHLRNFLVSEIDQLDVQGNSLSNEIDEISNKFEDIINELDKVDGTKQAAIMEVARFLLNASIANLQKIGRFLYQCLKVITVSLIIIGIIVVPFMAWTPMNELYPGYDLHFDIEGNNLYMFPCDTADNKTVSTSISESGMICRQSQHRSRRIYGENGFSRRKEYHLDIKLIIETKNNKKKKEKSIQFERRDVNDVIFEFGITTKKDDSSLYLYERKHDSWGITGYACKNDVGICLRTNEKQLFSENAIFKSRRNKSFIEASFTVKIELQKRRCKILSNDVPLHIFENVSNEFLTLGHDAPAFYQKEVRKSKCDRAFKLASTDSCPNTDGIVGICVFDPSRNCVNQDQCPSGYKCCPYGCGSQCLAVTVNFQHLGSCNAQMTGTLGAKSCGHDQACQTNEKCCSGHCVAVRKFSVNVLNPITNQ